MEPLEHLTVCFVSPLSIFPQNKFSRMRIMRCTTPLCRLLQQGNWTLTSHFSFTVCWASPPHPVADLWWRRVLPQVPEGVSPLWPEHLEGNFSSVCAFALGAGEDVCSSCLWAHPFLDACAWLKLQESPLEHCPIAFHWKHSTILLSTTAFLPFGLLLTVPLLTISFRARKLRVLICWTKRHLTANFELE